MSTMQRLQVQIGEQTDINKLKFLRDTGLDMILNDSDVTDFTSEDKAECVTIINERIVALGGEI